ncbi:MAG: 50S ribosomal protein L6 [Acidimicrobiales bacterium 20-64-4]|nr:MAG: 50S ribosomal protein L6 [Acidimicrobiales bacterium 20-64-4]
MIGLSLAVVLAASTGSAPHDRMAWFRNAKLGMFIHWGPVSLAGTEIGWSRGAQVPIETYDNLYKKFDPVKFNAPEGVTFEVPTPTRVIVKGADKEVVGQVAATIRKIRKPEPYKGKGVRYLGEKVLRKAGKAAK